MPGRVVTSWREPPASRNASSGVTWVVSRWISSVVRKMSACVSAPGVGRLFATARYVVLTPGLGRDLLTPRSGAIAVTSSGAGYDVSPS